MAISRKPISIKDVAFRTSFGLGPEKTENQGPNRERKAGRWGESMVRRGALERCETGANPLETRGKRKPVTPENDPRETGLSFQNGGGAGTRTRVQEAANTTVYERSLRLNLAGRQPHRQGAPSGQTAFYVPRTQQSPAQGNPDLSTPVTALSGEERADGCLKRQLTLHYAASA